MCTPERCHAFVCDLTKDPLPEHIPPPGVDLVTMIFVLSAVPPEGMVDALRNVASILRPGGVVIFRDYGLHDHAQLRFGPGHRIDDHLYVRQDGTLAFYFDLGTERARASRGGTGDPDVWDGRLGRRRGDGSQRAWASASGPRVWRWRAPSMSCGRRPTASCTRPWTASLYRHASAVLPRC